MLAVALSFDEDVPARQPFRRSPRCAAVPPPSANDNHRTRCTVTRLFKAPRAPRFGAWGPSGELLAESDETGVVKREYVYLGNLPVAQVDGATGEVFYIHADHLGTPQAVTDALGQLAWEDAYQPFGTATNTGAATAVAMDLRFPGQRLDAETGYHYNYFRDYDPTLGRYLQSDPIGLAGGLNTYGYVGGNPISYADPTGESQKLWQLLGKGEKLIKRIPGASRFLRSLDKWAQQERQALEKSYNICRTWVQGLGKSKDASKGLGSNPFRGQSPSQIDKIFKSKGFDTKGPNPISGKGGYVNPKTGRSYHLDPGKVYKRGTEHPHVDVNRLGSTTLKKKKYPLGDKLYE